MISKKWYWKPPNAGLPERWKGEEYIFITAHNTRVSVSGYLHIIFSKMVHTADNIRILAPGVNRFFFFSFTVNITQSLWWDRAQYDNFYICMSYCPCQDSKHLQFHILLSSQLHGKFSSSLSVYYVSLPMTASNASCSSVNKLSSSFQPSSSSPESKPLNFLQFQVPLVVGGGCPNLDCTFSPFLLPDLQTQSSLSVCQSAFCRLFTHDSPVWLAAVSICVQSIAVFQLHKMTVDSLHSKPCLPAHFHTVSHLPQQKSHQHHYLLQGN